MKRQKRIWIGLLLTVSMMAVAGCTPAQTGQGLPTQTGIPVDMGASGTTQSAQLTEEQAKQAALKHAGYAEDQVQSLQVRLDKEDGKLEYEVEFQVGQTEYDYDIDALTGEIRSHDFDAEHNGAAIGQAQSPATATPSNPKKPAATMANNNDIGQEKAKSIALAHAGMKTSEVTFTKVKLDRDDGRLTYELEFYRGQVEYDYDIDALTGEILSYERDTDEKKAPSTTAKPQKTQVPTTPNVIAQSKAKSIALQHAGVSASQVSRLKVELDRDDGRLEYEVEFHVGQMEYSYEIDAISGSVLSYEKELDD